MQTYRTGDNEVWLGIEVTTEHIVGMAFQGL